MGTGYYNKIEVVISGNIEEDIDTNKTGILKAELELICVKYGLQLDWEQT